METCKKCKQREQGFQGGDRIIGVTTYKEKFLQWWNCRDCKTTYIKKSRKGKLWIKDKASSEDLQDAWEVAWEAAPDAAWAARDAAWEVAREVELEKQIELTLRILKNENN